MGVAVITSVCGRLAPEAKSGPLHDPEFMLFVDDDQPELGERDVLLDDGLRSDDELHVARGNLRQRLAALGRRSVCPVSSSRFTRLCASSRSIVCQCWLARTSVGAMRTV